MKIIGKNNKTAAIPAITPLTNKLLRKAGLLILSKDVNTQEENCTNIQSTPVIIGDEA